MKKLKKENRLVKMLLPVACLAIVGILFMGVSAKADLSLMDRIGNRAGDILGNFFVSKVADTDFEVSEIFGAFPGPDIYSEIYFRDGFVNILVPVATTTGTGSSATLMASDLTGVGLHIVTLGGAVDTAFTYTLPASTTLQNFVPYIGAKQEVCWFNTASSTSTGADLIFAAGTGIDLMVSTTTTPVPLGAGEEEMACIDFYRQPDGTGRVIGDIFAVLKLYDNAD